MQWQIIGPMTPPLAAARQPDTPTAVELAVRAQRTIALIDGAIGPARSICRRCQATITTTARGCDSCGADFLAVEHRAPRTSQRAKFVLAAGQLVELEYRPAGSILAIR